MMDAGSPALVTPRWRGVTVRAPTHLPGALAHRGYGPGRLIEHLYLTTEGIWGVPLGVSADFVYRINWNATIRKRHL